MTDLLRSVLEEIQHETCVPALAGIVVSGSAMLAQAAMGVRRLGEAAPVTIDDRFHAGSNAKAMTATACAVLVNRGLLRWSTTPLELFPDLGESMEPQYKAITLEMLLTHRAGIPPYTDDEAEDFVLPNWTGIKDEEQVRCFSRWLLQNQKPVHEPGSGFAYSNAGYSIAAAMAESASGSPWRSLLHETMFAPLGIEAVAGGGWPARQFPDQPWGHFLSDGALVPHDPDDDYQPETFLAPAGDVSISLPNYGRFLRMQLRGLRGQETLLPAELVRHMHNDGRPGTGMGWGVTTLRSMEELGLFSTHVGSAGTFILVAAVSHTADLAAGLATNACVPAVMQGIKKIIACFVST